MKAKWIKQITVFVLSVILAAGSGTAGLAYAEDTAVVTDDNAASDVTDDQTPQDAVSDGSSDTVISDDSGDSQDSSEEEFIPDEYYEPVQTNDISGLRVRPSRLQPVLSWIWIRVRLCMPKTYRESFILLLLRRF